MTPEQRIKIGKITTAHGIKGLVKIEIYAEDPHLIEKSGPVFTSEDGPDFLSIKLKNRAGKIWLAEIRNISDRTDAEKFRNTFLWIGRGALPPAAAHEIYHHELVGMTVIDQTEKIIGHVTSVDNFGAGDLIDIRPSGGSSFYLPFSPDFIEQIDQKKKTVRVYIPEGYP